MKQRYYVNHWDKWPLPVLPVPVELNPFKEEGVDLSVVLAFHLPFENIKFLTTYGMLREAEMRGMLRNVHTLVEATSGNTGIVLAAMAKSFGVSRVKLVVAPDLPDGKRYPLIMAGADIISPEEGLSAIATARKLGKQDGHLNLDQYSNMDGTTPHMLFTAPKILEQTTYPPTVFVAAVGTGGTLIGVSDHFRNTLEKITIVGVLLSLNNEVPGVRDLDRMKEVTLPWRESYNDCVEVEARPSYLAALSFNGIMGITPGPSSGLAYLGALKLLWEHKMSGTLDSLRNRLGSIHVVILFPDGNRPYGDRFMANLPYDFLKPSTAPLPWQFPGHELW